jgi:hypothetical protein
VCFRIRGQVGRLNIASHTVYRTTDAQFLVTESLGTAECNGNIIPGGYLDWIVN